MHKKKSQTVPLVRIPISHPDKCKLCGNKKPLCRSHIVPEFTYAPIKNEKNQIYSFDGQKVKKVQTGYFEKMLCQDCENLISGYESKFKTLWMDTIPSNFNHLATKPLDDFISVEVTDYDAFKLFHLSVFWRAVVSNGFKSESMSFGPYEAEIAELLRNGDPGQPGDFPFLGVLSLDNNRRPVSMITQLAKGEGGFEGHDYYMTNYAFCDWTFVVARPGPQWMVDLENECRRKNTFHLHTVPHTQSKSFTLWAEIMQKHRQ